MICWILCFVWDMIKMNFKKEKNYFDSYEYIADEIKFLTNSEIRLKILDCLVDNPISMKMLNDSTDLSYSSISSNVHKLEDHGYIIKESGKYYLTNLAKIHLANIRDFNESIAIINDFSDFWTDHNVQPLYIDSLKDLAALEGSRLIECAPIDIYKTHNEFKDMISDSIILKVIFPYLHPEYPKLIGDLVEGGAHVEILLPEPILTQFINFLGKDVVKSGFKKGNLIIKSLKIDAEIALAVSNEFVSLGLFKSDGSYDQNRLLVSNEPEAMDWAQKIFYKYDVFGKKIGLRNVGLL